MIRFSLSKSAKSADIMFHFDDENKSHDMVDQSSGQSVMRAASGFIENDLTALTKAQSQAQVDAILRKLGDARKSSSLPDDVTNEQAIELCTPAFIKDSTEFVDVSMRLAAKQQELFAKPDEPAVEESVVEPAVAAPDPDGL